MSRIQVWWASGAIGAVAFIATTFFVTLPQAGANAEPMLPQITSSAEPVVRLGYPEWFLAIEAREYPDDRRELMRKVTYSVETSGATTTRLSQLASEVDEILNHGRGWTQLGIEFEKVADGGEFQVVLAEASRIPLFSAGCDAEWSCRVGEKVIINESRWVEGTPEWNSAGGTIAEYRTMLINYEVGHWLGHDHPTCQAEGQLAPIMLQQSMNLGACKFNPWPLQTELWTDRT
ncbi:DUF3152 domain-containing protein [Candidatus Saccharibacteria bacterium]|nr:DUF3152 domain-containing protein [Candidatus Saccharibacteria bacterium]